MKNKNLKDNTEVSKHARFDENHNLVSPAILKNDNVKIEKSSVQEDKRERQRQRWREYYQKNKEKYREWNKKWREKQKVKKQQKK